MQIRVSVSREGSTLKNGESRFDSEQKKKYASGNGKRGDRTPAKRPAPERALQSAIHPTNVWDFLLVLIEGFPVWLRFVLIITVLAPVLMSLYRAASYLDGAGLAWLLQKITRIASSIWKRRLCSSCRIGTLGSPAP